LAKLSFHSETRFIKLKAHETAFTDGDTKHLPQIEEQIDALAAQLRGLTSVGLGAIRVTKEV